MKNEVIKSKEQLESSINEYFNREYTLLYLQYAIDLMPDEVERCEEKLHEFLFAIKQNIETERKRLLDVTFLSVVEIIEKKFETLKPKR